MDNIREPVVAGYFYPEKHSDLTTMLERFCDPEVEKEPVKSLIAPHAGYVFSGKTAGMTYSRADIPETAIILGPNHSGYGEPYAVAAYDKWITPLGQVETDKDLSAKLVGKNRYLEQDNVAHSREHSVEVQLPFLQFFNRDIKIAAVTLQGYLENPAWVSIGETIAEVIQQSGKNVLIVASSDMTHYQSQEIAEENDYYAIEPILSLNTEVLIDRIAERDISMCGFAPVIISLTASRNLGAKKAFLVDYTTSAQASGDRTQVVGYAGIIIE
jgi:MEMO1 family protein